MPAHTHWRYLTEEHWAALERCCSSTSGRAQLDPELAQPLLDLGWVSEFGYGYAPTRPGHDAHEAGPPPSTTCEIVDGPWQEQGRPRYESPTVVVVSDRSPLAPCYTEQRPSSLPWAAMLVEDALRWACPFVALAAALWLLAR